MEKATTLKTKKEKMKKDCERSIGRIFGGETKQEGNESAAQRL